MWFQPQLEKLGDDAAANLLSENRQKSYTIWHGQGNREHQFRIDVHPQRVCSAPDLTIDTYSENQSLAVI